MPSMKPYLKKRPLPPVVRRRRAARVSAALVANPRTPARLIAERDRFHRQVVSVRGKTGDYIVQFKTGDRRFSNRDSAEQAMLAAIRRGDKPMLFLAVKLPDAVRGQVKGHEVIWTYPSLLNTEGTKKMNANPSLAAQARPIVQEVLRMHGLSNKFTIKKTSFSGFGYGDGYFVTIEGWKPDRELGMRVKVFILEKLSVIRLPSVDEDHWVVEFKGPGIVGNPRRPRVYRMSDYILREIETGLYLGIGDQPTRDSEKAAVFSGRRLADSAWGWEQWYEALELKDNPRRNIFFAEAKPKRKRKAASPPGLPTEGFKIFEPTGGMIATDTYPTGVNLPPFQYVEAYGAKGRFALIAFGAYNAFGLIGPEMGGVALVDNQKKSVIGTITIPYSREKRLAMFKKIFSEINWPWAAKNAGFEMRYMPNPGIDPVEGAYRATPRRGSVPWKAGKGMRKCPGCGEPFEGEGQCFRCQHPEIKRPTKNPEMYGTHGSCKLRMTLKQALSASGPGQADKAVGALVRTPSIARQLGRINASALRDELREYGAWDAAELADHQANLRRWVWIVAGDIAEEYKTSRRNPGQHYYKLIAHVPAKRRWEVVGKTRSRKQAIEIAKGLPTLSSGAGRTYSPYSDIIVKDVGSPKGTPFFGQIVFRLYREFDGKKEKWTDQTPSYRGNPGGYTVEWVPSTGRPGDTGRRRHSSDATLLRQLTYLREKGLAYTLYDSTGKVLESRKAHASKNPGQSYHKREARRYAKMLKGDLKAGHRDAADYWQGALSAEAASVAVGGVVRNPMTKKREEWQRRFTRLLMKRFGASVESLDLKKVFRMADKLYMEGFSATKAVATAAFYKAGLGKVGGNPLTWFHVYLGNKLIDAIPVGDKMSVEDMRLSLIDHDGYDHRIRVVKTRDYVGKAELAARASRNPGASARAQWAAWEALRKTEAGPRPKGVPAAAVAWMRIGGKWTQGREWGWVDAIGYQGVVLAETASEARQKAKRASLANLRKHHPELRRAPAVQVRERKTQRNPGFSPTWQWEDWFGAFTLEWEKRSGRKLSTDPSRAKIAGWAKQDFEAKLTPISSARMFFCAKNPGAVDRDRVRRVQDAIVRWAEAHGHGDNERLTGEYEGSPTIGEMRKYLYAQWLPQMEALAREHSINLANPGADFHKARYREERGARDGNLGRAREARDVQGNPYAVRYSDAKGEHNIVFRDRRSFERWQEKALRQGTKYFRLQRRFVGKDMKKNPLLMVVPNPSNLAYHRMFAGAAREASEARKLGVPEQHQLRIALKTLKMTPAMAGIMGGMSIPEAKAFLKRVGYSDQQIAKLAQNPIKRVGSQTQEPLAETDYKLVARGRGMVVLYDRSLKKYELWFANKHAASYVIRIGNTNYEFARTLTSTQVGKLLHPVANPRKKLAGKKGKKRKWGEVVKSLTIPALASIALRGAVSAGAGIGLKAAATAAGVAANPSSCDMGTLMKNPRFAQAVKLYRKFHGCDPKSVKRVLIPIGDKKRIDGREFFVSLGKAPSEAYDPPSHSGKAGSIFVHPYERKPEKVVSADGKTIVTLPGSHRVTDWIRG